MYESMDELVASVGRQLEKMRQLQDDVAGLRASATSADGAVTVTVDGNGAIVGLALSYAISRLTPESFGSAVAGTAHRAAAAVFARRAELVDAFHA